MNYTQKSEESRRLDNLKIIDFLTSLGGALYRDGILSPQDSNDLRVSIHNFQNSPAFSTISLLSRFAEENDLFLTMLISRFGPIGLCQNLFRLTMSRHLMKTNYLLNNFGHQLLEKSRLFLNRSFHIHFGGKCQRRILLSQLLVELSGRIRDASDDLGGILDQLSSMVGSDELYQGEEEKELDHQISKALGFKRIKSELIPFQTENFSRMKLVLLLNVLVQELTDILAQYCQNQPQVDTAEVKILLEILEGSAMEFTALKLSPETQIGAMELRRYHFVNEVSALNILIEKLFAKFLSIITPAKLSSLEPTLEAKSYPLATKRQLTWQLIRSGIAPTVATGAVQSLIDYCQRQNISATKIIPSELVKINPHLSVELLTALQEVIADSAVSGRASDEKGRIMQLGEKLLQGFKENIDSIATIMIVMLFIISCGVKTPIRSLDPDFRPEIPFKEKNPPLNLNEKPARIEDDIQGKNQSKTRIKEQSNGSN